MAGPASQPAGAGPHAPAGTPSGKDGHHPGWKPLLAAALGYSPLLRIPARSEREMRENAAEGLRTNPYQGWFVGISGTKVQLGMLTYIWRDHYETTLHPPARAAERFNYAGSLFGFEV